MSKPTLMGSLLILPWNGLYSIGTTDVKFDGDLDHLEAAAVGSITSWKKPTVSCPAQD